MQRTIENPVLRVGLCFSLGVFAAATQTALAQDTDDQAGDNAEYIAFLEENSMLYQANVVAGPILDSGIQWREDFGTPEPDGARDLASVWMFRYPLSTIPTDGSSVIATWADSEFWTAAG